MSERCLTLALLVLALPLAAPAVAAELPGVGSEVDIGVNGTGESCRLRVVQEEAPASAGRGEAVDPALLRALPRLRESADEVKKIAAALGASADAIVLGAAATERRVLATDLGRYRVVAFATHGLLPGELQCQAEPALALTPPPAPTKGEDGLLDASEIATLKLDADWVVLSACNTAGPDGSLGGESLSGLTRAFFYAGARALLASHWAVASGPTVDLTTAMFREYAGGGALGKAEALRRAQTALRARKETAHPFFWAPFVLMGDGGLAAP